MKVLLVDVYNYNKGGAETVCFNTGEMLEKEGHEIVYFTLKWDNNLPSKFERYFPESKETRKGMFRQVINLRNYFYYPDAARKMEQLILDENARYSSYSSDVGTNIPFYISGFEKI